MSWEVAVRKLPQGCRRLKAGELLLTSSSWEAVVRCPQVLSTWSSPKAAHSWQLASPKGDGGGTHGLLWPIMASCLTHTLSLLILLVRSESLSPAHSQPTGGDSRA